MIDLSTEQFRNNPYPAYEEVRNAGTAIFDDRLNQWYVGRYADVVRILRNGDGFSSSLAGFESTLVGQDGQEHLRIRKMIQVGFSPEHIKSLQPAIKAEAQRVVTTIAGREEFELISEVAGAVPAAVLSWMLGTGDMETDTFHSWAKAILSSPRRANIPGGKSGLFRICKKLFPAGRKRAAIQSDVMEFEQFLKEHFRTAMEKKSEGWITNLLCENYAKGLITMPEIIDLCMVFVVAASETTISFMGTAAKILAENDELQLALRSDETLLDSFLEEVLRYDSPTQRRPRFAVDDIQINEVTFKKGDTIIALIGSAHRDADKFPHPDVFDIYRKPNQHIAFGAGPHICPGAQLGRMEAKAMVGSILENLSPFRLARPNEKIEQNPYIMLRGPAKLFLEFEK